MPLRDKAARLLRDGDFFCCYNMHKSKAPTAANSAAKPQALVKASPAEENSRYIVMELWDPSEEKGPVLAIKRKTGEYFFYPRGRYGPSRPMDCVEAFEYFAKLIKREDGMATWRTRDVQLLFAAVAGLARKAVVK